MKSTDKCKLIKRGDFFDVYLNGKNYGYGWWAYIDTAYYIYKSEGYDVEIINKPSTQRGS